MGRITFTRRAIQTFSFFAIVYGGFLAGPALNEESGEILNPAGYAGSYERQSAVRWVEREQVPLPVFMPLTACYYQHRGVFSGCALLFVSESLGHLSPLVQITPYLLLLLVLMFAVGRLWCGWVCPFGFLGDVLGGIRKLLGLDHVRLSRRVRDGLVWTKYSLLAATVLLSVLAAVPALAHYRPSLFNSFCQVCLGKYASPFLSFASICWTNWNDWISGTLTVLGFVALGFFFLSAAVRRLYCRICPVGGLAAPFNRYGLISLRKRGQRCTRCGACARVCPVDNLTVYEGMPGVAAGGRLGKAGSVDACECTLCLRCVEGCPEEGCMELTLAGRRVVGS